MAQIAVSEDRNALFLIESTRHLLEIETRLAPLAAYANHGWEQSAASRAGMDKAAAVAQHLTGQSPREILALDFTQQFLSNNIRPRLLHGVEGFGALNGEPGFYLLKHVMSWHGVAGSLDFDF